MKSKIFMIVWNFHRFTAAMWNWKPRKLAHQKKNKYELILVHIDLGNVNIGMSRVFLKLNFYWKKLFLLTNLLLYGRFSMWMLIKVYSNFRPDLEWFTRKKMLNHTSYQPSKEDQTIECSQTITLWRVTSSKTQKL